MFKGGCYQPSEVPGSSLCKAAPAGICTSPASEGYFVPPDADTAHQSVLACNDTDIVTLQNGKKYTGVTSCATCIQPSAAEANTPKAATCTACETTTPTYLKTVDGVTTCVPKSDCNNGFFVEENATPKKCTACNDNANCIACTGSSSNQCTRCKADGTKPYLKKEGETDAGSCVDITGCTTEALYYTDDTDTAESGKTCKKCSEGVANCEQCTAPAQGKTKPACTKCSGDNYLKTVDGATTCVAKGDCKDDYFPKEDNSNGHKCLSCGDETSGVPNCAKCTAPSQEGEKPACSECGSGYKLEGGACVPTGGPNLSTGAIAGISVAAVVVVGGLVGFLCWWFLCRGKA